MRAAKSFSAPARDSPELMSLVSRAGASRAAIVLAKGVTGAAAGRPTGTEAAGAASEAGAAASAGATIRAGAAWRSAGLIVSAGAMRGSAIAGTIGAADAAREAAAAWARAAGAVGPRERASIEAVSARQRDRFMGPFYRRRDKSVMGQRSVPGPGNGPRRFSPIIAP